MYNRKRSKSNCGNGKADSYTGFVGGRQPLSEACKSNTETDVIQDNPGFCSNVMKIMFSMGYIEGEGLGKNHQGITNIFMESLPKYGRPGLGFKLPEKKKKAKGPYRFMSRGHIFTELQCGNRKPNLGSSKLLDLNSSHKFLLPKKSSSTCRYFLSNESFFESNCIEEKQRRYYEERERIMIEMVNESLKIKDSDNELLSSDIRLRTLIHESMKKAQQLKKLYEEKDALRKVKIPTLRASNDTRKFYSELTKIKEFHSKAENFAEKSLKLSLKEVDRFPIFDKHKYFTEKVTTTCGVSVTKSRFTRVTWKIVLKGKQSQVQKALDCYEAFHKQHYLTKQGLNADTEPKLNEMIKNDSNSRYLCGQNKPTSDLEAGPNPEIESNFFYTDKVDLNSFSSYEQVKPTYLETGPNSKESKFICKVQEEISSLSLHDQIKPTSYLEAGPNPENESKFIYMVEKEIHSLSLHDQIKPTSYLDPI